jgi:hypothetical protein
VTSQVNAIADFAATKTYHGKAGSVTGKAVAIMFPGFWSWRRVIHVLDENGLRSPAIDGSSSIILNGLLKIVGIFVCGLRH